MKIVSFGPVRAEQTGILRGDGRIVPLGPLLVEAGFAPLKVSQFLGMLDLIQPVIEPLVGPAGVSFSERCAPRATRAGARENHRHRGELPGSSG